MCVIKGQWTDAEYIFLCRMIYPKRPNDRLDLKSAVAKYLPAALFLGINPFMVCQIAFVRLVMLLLLSCTDLQHQTFGSGKSLSLISEEFQIRFALCLPELRYSVSSCW